jgi:hypothetical protein
MGSAGFNASTVFTGVMIVSQRIDDYVQGGLRNQQDVKSLNVQHEILLLSYTTDARKSFDFFISVSILPLHQIAGMVRTDTTITLNVLLWLFLCNLSYEGGGLIFC